MRIRHYGYLANRVRVKQLEKIRECLKAAKVTAIQSAKSGYSPTTQADSSSPGILNAQAPEHCPKCKIGFLRLIGEIASERERRRYGELM